MSLVVVFCVALLALTVGAAGLIASAQGASDSVQALAGLDQTISS